MPFCNFNLIFTHRYRLEQTVIIRTDLIRPRCLSVCAYFFRPFSHFRKSPRVAPRLCTIKRKSVKTVATHFDMTWHIFIFSVSSSPLLSLSPVMRVQWFFSVSSRYVLFVNLFKVGIKLYWSIRTKARSFWFFLSISSDFSFWMV